MMDYIAGLVQRGLISPDVAQGLVQQVTDLKNRMPFESGGGAPTNSIYTPKGYGEQTAPAPKPKRQFNPLSREDSRIEWSISPNVEIVPDQPFYPERPTPGKPGTSPRYLEQKARRLDKDK